MSTLQVIFQKRPLPDDERGCVYTKARPGFPWTDFEDGEFEQGLKIDWGPTAGARRGNAECSAQALTLSGRGSTDAVA